MDVITISRGEPNHVGFADVAAAANGDLVVMYKQADAHTSHDFTNLVVRISQDEGRTWTEPVLVMQTLDAINFGLIRDARLLRLHDGSLLAAASTLGPRRGFTRGTRYFTRYADGARAFLFRSYDHGRSWQTQEIDNIPMICGLRQLRSGVLLLGATRFSYQRNPQQVSQAQLVYRSLDGGQTWSDPIAVGDHADHALGEGDFVELDDGTIVCYMRDEIFRADLPVRTTGSKCLSTDGGLTWQGPYSAGRWLFNGRIACGLLSTGEVMVLTRLGMGAASPYSGTFFYEPRRLPEFVGYYQAASPLTHAYIESQASARQPNPPFTTYAHPLPPGSSWRLIDEDRSLQPDFGYAGWVNLPGGDVFAVDFLADDIPATLCQIRGYRLALDELLRPGRGAEFDFQAAAYQSGQLSGQMGWVHHGGPHATPTVVVEAGRGITSNATVTPLAGEVAPSLEPGKALAEVVRHVIGPFNLFDELVTVEFKHSGAAEWCALQLLDDCRQVIAEIQVLPDNQSMRAYVPQLWQTLDSGLASGQNIWHTRAELSPAGVSFYSKPAASGSYGPAWGQASPPELQVVGAVAVQLGGAGNFVLHGITVGAAPTRQTA